MSAAVSARITAAALRAMDRETFVEAFGGVFENSPWVAEAAWPAGPFAGAETLHAAMSGAMREAPRERQQALIEAHPDLAGRAAIAGEMSAESRREQAGAGLDQCTAEEFARFQALNDAYKHKFGFPFIVAVRSSDRAEIIASFAERLENDDATEFGRALDEIARIARFRLDDILED